MPVEVTQKPEMSPGNCDNWDSDLFQIAEIHMAENFGMSRKLTGKLEQDFDNHALEDVNDTNHGETITSKYSIATELPPACASIKRSMCNQLVPNRCWTLGLFPPSHSKISAGLLLTIPL